MAINELECTHCGGTGYHGETKCPKCDGTGKITGWNAVSPTSLEYNSSGFMDELTNPEKEPLEFYAGGPANIQDSLNQLNKAILPNPPDVGSIKPNDLDTLMKEVGIKIYFFFNLLLITLVLFLSFKLFDL